MTGVKGSRAVRGPQRIETSKRGFWLLKNPSTHKDLGFTQEERDQLGLNALLPPKIRTIEEVVRESMWFPEYVPAVPRAGGAAGDS